jgi:hypothetical protein
MALLRVCARQRLSFVRPSFAPIMKGDKCAPTEIFGRHTRRWASVLHKGPTVYRRIVFPTAALEARARWKAVNGKSGKTMLRVRVYYLDEQRVREYPPALFRYSPDPLNASYFSRRAAVEAAMKEAIEAVDAYLIWLALALQDENTLLFDGMTHFFKFDPSAPFATSMLYGAQQLGEWALLLRVGCALVESEIFRHFPEDARKRVKELGAFLQNWAYRPEERVAEVIVFRDADGQFAVKDARDVVRILP